MTELRGRKLCPHCEEPILDGEATRDVPHMETLVESIGLTSHTVRTWHQVCFFRSIAGGLAHQERRCRCYGGTADELDPPEMTKRQAAQAAWDAHRNTRGN